MRLERALAIFGIISGGFISTLGAEQVRDIRDYPAYSMNGQKSLDLRRSEAAMLLGIGMVGFGGCVYYLEQNVAKRRKLMQ